MPSCSLMSGIPGREEIDGIWLAPAWLEGREVIAVFESRLAAKPGYFMWLEWRGNEITFIRDYKYVRYVMADAELIISLRRSA